MTKRVEKPDPTAALQQRIDTCEIVSGALMECSGTLKRVRAALHGLLTPEVQKILEDSSLRLLSQAISSGTEAETFKIQLNKLKGWRTQHPDDTPSENTSPEGEAQDSQARGGSNARRKRSSHGRKP